MTLQTKKIDQHRTSTVDARPAIQTVCLKPLNDIDATLQAFGGISRNSLYRMVKRGEIRLVKIGRRSFVTHTEILRRVAALEADAEAEAAAKLAAAAEEDQDAADAEADDESEEDDEDEEAAA